MKTENQKIENFKQLNEKINLDNYRAALDLTNAGKKNPGLFELLSALADADAAEKSKS